MTSKSVPNLFLSDLWSLTDASPVASRVQKSLQNLEAQRLLLDGLLLHKSIVIPTQDLTELIVLLKLLGQKNIIDLIEDNSIRILRVKNSLAYLTRHGVGAFTASHQFKNSRTFHPFSTDLGELVPQFSNYISTEHSMMPLDTRLVKLLQQRSQEVDIKKVQLTIYNNAKQDILSHPSLYPEFTDVNFEQLPGVPDDEMTIISDEMSPTTNKLVQTLLEISVAHMELLLAKQACASDFTTSRGYVRKLLNRVIDTNFDAALGHLFMHSEIPDLLPLLTAGTLDPKDLVKLRRSLAAGNFREWFHSNCRNTSPENITQEYIKLLKQVPQVNSVGGKVVRCLSGLALSTVAPLIGTAMGAAPLLGAAVGSAYSLFDYFMLEDIAGGHSPKIFLERLERLSKD